MMQQLYIGKELTMQININKTKTMMINKKSRNFQIVIDKQEIEQMK